MASEDTARPYALQATVTEPTLSRADAALLSRDFYVGGRITDPSAIFNTPSRLGREWEMPARATSLLSEVARKTSLPRYEQPPWQPAQYPTLPDVRVPFHPLTRPDGLSEAAWAIARSVPNFRSMKEKNIRRRWPELAYDLISCRRYMS